MLSRRIIPCLDVTDGKVVKGVQFKNHEIVGEIVDLAQRYVDEGADELVFYHITASADGQTVNLDWVDAVAQRLDIPFCVAGGIRRVADAAARLEAGADKISINSPALERPDFIDEMVAAFGSQCVVIGIDSLEVDGQYQVKQYTGRPDKMQDSRRDTLSWAKEAVERGAGEIVLNCMNQDGVRQGYDIRQLAAVRAAVSVPLIASGGAGTMEHFNEVFEQADVDGALAASVFHKQIIAIPELKAWLSAQGQPMRL
jgi:cyclase